MNITQDFWSPTLMELPLKKNNIGTEQNQRNVLISSNENTYDVPDENNPQWKRINKIFFGVCDWFLNDKTKKYHISVRIYDLYHCFYTSSSCDYLNRLSSLLPKSAREDLVRQNFINLPNCLTGRWHERGHFNTDILRIFLDTFFHNASSLQEIASNDIRIFINFMLKIKHFNKRLPVQISSIVNIYTCIDLTFEDKKTLPKVIFSGGLPNIPSSFNKETFITYCGIGSCNDFFTSEEAFPHYQEFQPYLKMREQVFINFFDRIKNRVDQQHPVTDFPKEISQIVTDYTYNLETFLTDSAPNDLESFASECMSRLDEFDRKNN